jgi:hypothetical protein
VSCRQAGCSVPFTFAQARGIFVRCISALLCPSASWLPPHWARSEATCSPIAVVASMRGRASVRRPAGAHGGANERARGACAAPRPASRASMRRGGAQTGECGTSGTSAVWTASAAWAEGWPSRTASALKVWTPFVSQERFHQNFFSFFIN